MLLSNIFIRLGLFFLIPISLLIHGLIWVNLGYSSAAMVYSMKLSYIIVLVGMLIFCGFRVTKNINWRDYLIIWGLLLTVLFSTFSPFMSEIGSLKYLISDFVGFLLIPIYYVAAVSYIKKTENGIENFINLIIDFTVAISIVVIFYYIYSGGDKVSIPPELHFGAAISFAAVIFCKNKIKLSSYIKIIIIIFACVVSQQRINLLILIVPIALYVLMNAFNVKKIVLFFTILVLFAYVIFIFKSDLLTQVIMSFALTESSQGGFEDGSANQRIVEISLIINEMSKFDYLTQIFGKGLGAEYENLGGTIPHYDEYMHHAHSSPFLIWLRNGLFGVVIFFILPLIYAPLFRKNNFNYIALSGLISTYLALLVDQYIYWGALYSFSLALASCTLSDNRNHNV